MTYTTMGHHISSHFNLEMEDIHDKVIAMGKLVEQQFKFAVQAFVNCEIDLAENAIRQVTKVDDYEVSISKKCTEILTRRQPIAFDLKLLFAIIKTITELQRIGHINLHIARRALQSCNVERNSPTNHEVEHLYDIVKDMLHQALETYANLKNNQIPKVAAQENAVTQEYTLIFQQLVAQTRQDTQSIKHAINVLFTLRDIERIAEKAVLICKNVFYLLEGKNDADQNAHKL
jgi:phosphate transport system protein